MEEELKELILQINKITWLMNKPQFNGMKDHNEKKMTKLLARKKILESKITESILLDK